MFDHLSLTVSSFEASFAFYRAALGALGYQPRDLDPSAKSVGFGPPERTMLWLAEGAPSTRVHLAFQAPDRRRVAEFHGAALAAGGTDHGAPGLRPAYAKDYFAAFVLDPDGNNLEAVAHEDEHPVFYLGTYDLHDAERFRTYPATVSTLLPKYGGRVLAADPSARVLEGAGHGMSAVIQFPSESAALALYDDPAYQEAKRTRQASTRNISMVLAKAVR